MNNDTDTSATPIDWSTFKAFIDNAHVILLMSHIRPDGDAIGSQIAFARALTDYGKKVILINADPVPPNLQFLDPDRLIHPLTELTNEQKKEMEQADLLVSLDTSSWAQLGAMGEIIKQTSAPKLVLDHHIKGDDIGAVCYVDPSAEAAGVIVVQAIEALGLPMKKEYAFPLFVSIASDTGWFRFNSVTAKTYRLIADLTDIGIRPNEVYRIIYEQESFSRMKLIGLALVKAEQFLNNKGIITSLSIKDFDTTGALPSDSEDIINQTLKTDGTLVAVIMVEQRSGGYKLSFRSRCNLDCSLLAAKFGGGGHKKAAGAFINLPYEVGREKILAEVIAMMKDCGY